MSDVLVIYQICSDGQRSCLAVRTHKGMQSWLESHHDMYDPLLTLCRAPLCDFWYQEQCATVRNSAHEIIGDA